MIIEQPATRSVPCGLLPFDGMYQPWVSFLGEDGTRLLTFFGAWHTQDAALASLDAFVATMQPEQGVTTFAEYSVVTAELEAEADRPAVEPPAEVVRALIGQIEHLEATGTWSD